MTGIERLSWSEFEEQFVWFQGEHVSLIGPTGAGKTTLALALLPFRKYCTVFGTKPKDSTLSALLRRDWTRLYEWGDKEAAPNRWQGTPAQKLVLWPRFKSMADAAHHHEIFREALHEMFVDEGWCVFVDEVRYIAKDLGLHRELNQYWLQGRSIDLSIIAATQRPVWVPPEMYNQATHLFLWRASDRRDLSRIQDISGNVDRARVAQTVQALDFNKYEVLYVNVRTGELIITTPPKA